MHWTGILSSELNRMERERNSEHQNHRGRDQGHDEIQEKVSEMDATVFPSNGKSARFSPDENGLQEGCCSQGIKQPEQKKPRPFAREFGAEVNAERNCDGGEDQSAHALFGNRRCGHGNSSFCRSFQLRHGGERSSPELSVASGVCPAGA